MTNIPLYFFLLYYNIWNIPLNTTTKYLLLNIFAIIEITYLIFNVCFHVVGKDIFFLYACRAQSMTVKLSYKKVLVNRNRHLFWLKQKCKSYYYFISNYYYYYISILWYKEQWKSSTGDNKIEIKNRVQWKVSKLCIKDGSFEKN